MMAWGRNHRNPRNTRILFLYGLLFPPKLPEKFFHWINKLVVVVEELKRTLTWWENKEKVNKKKQVEVAGRSGFVLEKEEDKEHRWEFFCLGGVEPEIGALCLPCEIGIVCAFVTRTKGWVWVCGGKGNGVVLVVSNRVNGMWWRRLVNFYTPLALTLHSTCLAAMLLCACRYRTQKLCVAYSLLSLIDG